MPPYSIADLRRVLSAAPIAEPLGDSVGGPRASVDSRTIRPGEIFFAIPGERTDGHRFVSEAFRRGASIAIVRRDRSDDLPGAVPRERVLAVDDTSDALVRLARAHRALFSARVIAVTGTNGKTTTKDLLGAIFAAEAPTLASPGNYNTIIGLSLTLLGLEPAHRFLIVELGVSAPGEMEMLGSLARPAVALFTNIHAAHLEQLGSLENVAREKGALAEFVEEGGAVHVNGDDPLLVAEMRRRRIAFHTFGLGEGCELRPARIEPWGRDGVALAFASVEGYRAPLYGMPGVRNLVAAVATAKGEGLRPDTITRGLAHFSPPAGRFRPERAGGVLLIDDSYNANLSSALAAIEFLRNVSGAGRRILVFGDMKELGARAEEDHRSVGRAASEAGLDRLVLVGESVRWTAEEAVARGMPEARVLRVAEREGVGAELAAELDAGDCVVVKGSRAMRMEEILDDLRKALTATSAGGRG
jgi:UDP-N-acetylmuramoyl-tripeptide--D-alanyl-D-alanine ligase